ncbi:MAG: ATP-dependent helicase [Bacillota bacterium]|nr:ATP-dependent helicase [Bacillota bacterium]
MIRQIVKANQMNDQQFFAWIKEKNLNLTEDQKRAILHDQGPLLLLAVPGAGKTTVLTIRIAYLILVRGAVPERILCLTFSRAAAKEMRERFAQNFRDRIKGQVHFSTIHSFAYTVVREYFKHQGIRYRLMEEQTGAESKNRVLRGLYKQVNFALPTEEQLDELQNTICYVKNRLCGPDDLANPHTANFVKIYQAYEEYKRENQPRLIDFDDMLVLAYQGLLENPWLLETFREQTDYILTDESQDTSLLQHKLIELIARPQENIFVVGDDDQSIFGFRAAEPQYLLDFPTVYDQAQVYRMEENFRSTPQIVDVACRFIRKNQGRFDKAMMTSNADGEALRIKQFKNVGEQTGFIREELQKTDRFSDVALLFRNNLSAISLVQELDLGGIPFYLRESSKERFFQHWTIKDVLNYMRFSYNDKSLRVFEKIWTKLDVYVNKTQLEYLQGIQIERPILEILAETADLPDKRRKDYLALNQQFHYLNTLAPFQAIRYIRSTMNYDEVIGRVCEQLGFAKEYMESILGILENIAAQEKNLPDFAHRLVHLETLIKRSAKNKNTNAVTLSTIHSAKGLEWEQVYLVDLVEGIIPDRQAVENSATKQSALEEERRLFYVGMTRAKHDVTLCVPNYYLRQYATVSMFVREVQRLLVDKDPTVKELTEADDFGVGLVVIHKQFGEGVITLEQEDVLNVRFDNGQERSFLKQFCIDKNILRAR